MTKRTLPLRSSRDEFRRILTQSEFHVFRGIESDIRHLTHFEWLKMRHVFSGELVEHDLKCGAIGNTWHLVEIHGRWISGYGVIQRAN